MAGNPFVGGCLQLAVRRLRGGGTGFPTNPTTLTQTGTSVLSSGDGAAGQNLVFRFVILPGDFNRDNKVDLADQSILQSHFGLTGVTPDQGDADGDVDLGDFNYMKANFGFNWQTFPYP